MCMAKITLWQKRDELNLTLKEVSERTEVSVAELNKIENNKVSPSINTLEKIAIGLQCTISELYFSKYK